MGGDDSQSGHLTLGSAVNPCVHPARFRRKGALAQTDRVLLAVI
jgi:hypothetical protein